MRNSSIQVYFCFWSTLTLLNINQNSSLELSIKITMITYQCGTPVSDTKFSKLCLSTLSNHQSCSSLAGPSQLWRDGWTDKEPAIDTSPRRRAWLLTKFFTAEPTTRFRFNIHKFWTLLWLRCSMVHKCHFCSQLLHALSSSTTSARGSPLPSTSSCQLLSMTDLPSFAWVFCPPGATCSWSMDSGLTWTYKFSQLELIISLIHLINSWNRDISFPSIFSGSFSVSWLWWLCKFSREWCPPRKWRLMRIFQTSITP